MDGRSLHSRQAREEVAVDVDPRAMGSLIEQSEDMQHDAMAATAVALDELVETGHEARAHGEIDPEESLEVAAHRRKMLTGAAFGGGLLAAAGIAGALDTLFASPAFAASPTDIQILQTQSSIEVLGVATYKKALTLPFIGGASANPFVKRFATTTMHQHMDHLAAYQAATRNLGGKVQTHPDPVVQKVVDAAVPGLVSPAAVVALALELEQGATETYVNDVAILRNSNAKKVTASIMGVEAQHAATLRTMQALLDANAPQLINLNPGNVANLPAAAGSAGFPDAFFPTDQARPATEGALK